MNIVEHLAAKETERYLFQRLETKTEPKERSGRHKCKIIWRIRCINTNLYLYFHESVQSAETFMTVIKIQSAQFKPKQTYSDWGS